MRKLIMAAIVCVSIYPLFANAQTNKDVLDAVKKYDDAWNTKDKANVDKIMAPDYIYFSSTGGTTSRQRALEFLVSPDYKLTFVERKEITAFVTGNTAVVSSRWIGKGSYSGGEINDDQRCSLVFAKVKKEWKLASEHCTQIVSK